MTDLFLKVWEKGGLPAVVIVFLGIALVRVYMDQRDDVRRFAGRDEDEDDDPTKPPKPRPRNSRPGSKRR